MVEASERSKNPEAIELYMSLRNSLLERGSFCYEEGSEGGFIILSAMDGDLQYTLRTGRIGFSEETARVRLGSENVDVIVVKGDDPATGPFGERETKAMYLINGNGETKSLFTPQKNGFKKPARRRNEIPTVEMISDFASKAQGSPTSF